MDLNPCRHCPPVQSDWSVSVEVIRRLRWLRNVNRTFGTRRKLYNPMSPSLQFSDGVCVGGKPACCVLCFSSVCDDIQRQNNMPIHFVGHQHKMQAT